MDWNERQANQLFRQVQELSGIIGALRARYGISQEVIEDIRTMLREPLLPERLAMDHPPEARP